MTIVNWEIIWCTRATWTEVMEIVWIFGMKICSKLIPEIGFGTILNGADRQV